MRKYHSSMMMVNLWIVLSSVWEIVPRSRASFGGEEGDSSSKEGFGEE